MSDSETPWTVAHQAPLCMGFSRQEYWSGLPFLPPADLPHPGIEPMSPALAGVFFTAEPPGKPSLITYFPSKYSLRAGTAVVFIFGPSCGSQDRLNKWMRTTLETGTVERSENK